MSLLEAMAYKCTCIASEVGGIPQVIEDGVDGILISPKDQESLKHAIRKVILDQEMQDRLGKAGRIKVEQEFELKKCMDKLVKIYQNLLINKLNIPIKRCSLAEQLKTRSIYAACKRLTLDPKIDTV